MKLNNKYYIARHGQAFSNGHRFFSSWPEKKVSYLLPEGKRQIKENAKFFKEVGLDYIFSSDLERTKDTAEIIAKETKAPLSFDKRLREIDFGIFNGQPVEEYFSYFKNHKERFTKRAPKGENLREVEKRMYDFLKDINKKYKGKKILIVSHGGPLWLLESKVKGKNLDQTVRAHGYRIKTGKFRILKNR